MSLFPLVKMVTGQRHQKLGLVVTRKETEIPIAMTQSSSAGQDSKRGGLRFEYLPYLMLPPNNLTVL